MDGPAPWKPRAARLPPPVVPGDRIGVAALSGIIDPERLDVGLDTLRALGYEPVEAPNLRSRCGIFAGDDGERLEGFHGLVADPSIRAIVFARGGHGVVRILPRIDWSLLARHPRAYVGYSDLTPLLLQIVQRLGWVTFHGPMVAADFARGMSDADVESFRAALAGSFPSRLALEGVAGGERVEGPLLGGCLSMLTAVLGTPWAADLSGAILFVEDVAEPPYRIDRMLTHLRLSGNLTGLKAMLAGHLTGGPGRAGDPRHNALCRGLEALADDFPWPWGWGLPAGHESPNRTLPLGLWTRLDPNRRMLELGVTSDG